MKFLIPIKSISILGLISLTSGQVLAEVDCHDRTLISAIAARQVQTQLMVGALQCRGNFDMGQRQIYKAYLQKFGSRLESEHQYLAARYQERHAAAATKRFDAYLTSLANQASLALLKEPSRCVGVAKAGQNLMDSDSVDWIAVRSEFPLTLADQENGICRVIDFPTVREAD